MRHFRDTYTPEFCGKSILDAGGKYDGNGSYRPTWGWPKTTGAVGPSQYIGIDMIAGPDVDMVCLEPYAWPLPSGSFDIVLCGQVLEHSKHPWKVVNEIFRVMRPGGHCCIIAPWQWEPHYFPVDCFRILPDGMRSMMEDAGLRVLECRMSENDTLGVGAK